MARIAYISKRFNDEALYMVALAARLCEAYADQGLSVTLRQVYYQFVARDWFPESRTWSWDDQRKRWYRDPNGTKNADPNYKWLGSLLNDARLAGYLDWDYIVDRTRNLRDLPHWDTAHDIIIASEQSFRIPKWETQDNYVEVWIEKDALVGVLESCCPQLDVPFFSCRGYTSQSELWGAAQRLHHKINEGKRAVVIHLGDHDPSGVDMTRDIHERLAMFISQDSGNMPEKNSSVEMWEYVENAEPVLIVDRIALTMDQIRQFDPPPNPAKLTDSRASAYVERYGYKSWELDALDPATLVGLIQASVESYRDDADWEDAVEREREERKFLTRAVERWAEVKDFLEGEAA
jgi:hypothetical protein